jgi:hypothetical protein
MSAPNHRAAAEYVFRKVCPEVDPALSLEIAVLESAFREVNDIDFVKAQITMFLRKEEFPADGPFRPLYIAIGYQQDRSDPRGFRFVKPVGPVQ